VTLLCVPEVFQNIAQYRQYLVSSNIFEFEEYFGIAGVLKSKITAGLSTHIMFLEFSIEN
jgi:hypothetical protein